MIPSTPNPPPDFSPNFPGDHSSDDGTTAPGCPSLVELAAHVEQQVKSPCDGWVEDHLKICSRCAELIVDFEFVTDADMQLVPRHVMESAMALVTEQSHQGYRRQWLHWTQRLAAAAAVIAVCAAGYQLGTQMKPDVEELDSIGREVSFEMFDGSDDGEGELFAMASNQERQEGRP